MITHRVNTNENLAELLGLNPRFLDAVLYKEGVDYYYRVFEIAKKSSGTRTIEAPTGHLLRIQQRVADYLQDQYRPRPAAHGFVRGRSVVTNAQPHVGKDFVLNLDLEDFFPTIHFGRVLGLFESEFFDFGHEAGVALAKLVCFNGHVPIGGPASPVIANMISSRMDGELQQLAHRHGAFYTRYADDLTFSWDHSGRFEPLGRFQSGGGVDLADDIAIVVEGNGFKLNDAKTRLMYRTQSQRVTGLVVNQRLNIDRATIRRLRAMIHSIERDGLDAAQARFDISDTRDRLYQGRDIEAHLEGWINYISMIRGARDPIVARLRRQLRNVLAGNRRNLGVRRYRDDRINRLDSDIEDVELALRWVVVTNLDNDAERLPQHLRRKIAERVKDAVDRGQATDVEWLSELEGMLEFADLRDLEEIIAHRSLWQHFEPLFAPKSRLGTRFDQLADLRNSIRHSRTLDDIIQMDGETAILWFRRALSLGN